MKPCNVQVSKLIILHEDGEDGKSEHVIHTVYSFNPLLYSMNSVMYRWASWSSCMITERIGNLIMCIIQCTLLTIYCTLWNPVLYRRASWSSCMRRERTRYLIMWLIQCPLYCTLWTLLCTGEQADHHAWGRRGQEIWVTHTVYSGNP